MLRRALDPIGGVNGPERLPRRVHQRVDRDALAAGTADRLLQQLRVECDQVVDALPLEPFDVTVDLIVTPTRTIEVPPGRPRPDHILWHLLPAEKLESIPLLRELKPETAPAR